MIPMAAVLPNRLGAYPSRSQIQMSRLHSSERVGGQVKIRSG
jgi:hypothetical protein